jgi:hypothetical protein
MSKFSSDVIFLKIYKSSGTPARLLIGSNDGVWRLLSPTSGKVLTTCIPVQQNATILDASYSPRNSMFHLLAIFYSFSFIEVPALMFALI